MRLASFAFRVLFACVAAMLASVAAAQSTPPPVPPLPGVGPQATIICPIGSVDIWPGTSIPLVVSLHPGTVTFCLRTGVHLLNSAITPKAGNTFVGEYGAVLDGTSMAATTDDTEAAFRAHNQDIDDVAIRNLVIRNFRRGIHAFAPLAARWTIEYNEIASNDSGLVLPSDSTIKNNYIHHNSSSGYLAPYAHNSTFEGNEIAYNGWEQKVAESANVTFRNNFVHHNTGTGIWYDSNNVGAVVEGNRVEDNGLIGIFYEISSEGVIRNNAVRRSGDAGVFLGTSKNTQIANNTLEHNFRGITYFLNCPSLTQSIDFDLMSNESSDNTIIVGTQSGALAGVFSYDATCTSAQIAPYLNGSKNLTFSRNTYRVPSDTTRYWFWGGPTLWSQWQSIGHDRDGTASQ